MAINSWRMRTIDLLLQLLRAHSPKLLKRDTGNRATMPPRRMVEGPSCQFFFWFDLVFTLQRYTNEHMDTRVRNLYAPVRHVELLPRRRVLII